MFNFFCVSFHDRPSACGTSNRPPRKSASSIPRTFTVITLQWSRYFFHQFPNHLHSLLFDSSIFPHHFLLFFYFTFHFLSNFFNQFIDFSSIDWLIDWLIHPPLIDWLIDSSFIDWLIDLLFGWLIDWLICDFGKLILGCGVARVEWLVVRVGRRRPQADDLGHAPQRSQQAEPDCGRPWRGSQLSLL